MAMIATNVEWGFDERRMGIWLEVDQPEALGQQEADGDEENWRRDDCRPRGDNSPRKYRREDQRKRGNVHGVIPHVSPAVARYACVFELFGITA
jgi:hypothetical protein